MTPQYDHLQTAAIFDVCCNQSVVMSDNLASARGPSPASPQPWKIDRPHMAILYNPSSLNASPDRSIYRAAHAARVAAAD